jgi:hypothetical protein
LKTLNGYGGDLSFIQRDLVEDGDEDEDEDADDGDGDLILDMVGPLSFAAMERICIRMCTDLRGICTYIRLGCLSLCVCIFNAFV